MKSNLCFATRAALLFVSLLHSNVPNELNAQACYAPPPGMVGWWRAEDDASDYVSLNNASLLGDVGYTVGHVGKAFLFDGDRDAVQIGNPGALQLQEFTIEAWVKRANTSVVTVGGWLGLIFSYGTGGYGVYLDPSGTPTLSHIEYSNVADSRQIADTEFHHLAVTKTALGEVYFYLDGIPTGPYLYNPTFTFNTPAQIGAWGNGPDGSFWGAIDDLAVFNRPLSAAEIKGIYTAGQSGKCFTPSAPSIYNQPSSVLVRAGRNATFSVVATGTSPLSYQWLLDGAPISGATQASLVLTNAQPANQGTYTVVIKNQLGSITSTGAVLTVRAAASCSPPVMGLVSWWRAEGGAQDEVSQNHGTLKGDVKVVSGHVSSAFQFDGDRDSVKLGNPENLRLQDFTIEAWIKRGSPAYVTSGGGLGLIFAYGTGGYGLYLDQNGTPTLTHIEFSNVPAAKSITDTEYHHVSVTKSGGSIVFYIDGEAFPAGPYNPSFTFETDAQIGAWGGGPNGSFFGQIDELAIYNRPLSPEEVLDIYDANNLGKCSTAVPPSIHQGPASKSAFAGQTISFNVVAYGTTPLSYQWSHDGIVVEDATNATLTLRNVQLAQAGQYDVVVKNDLGTAAATATLTVNPPPPCVKPPPGIVGWWTGNNEAFDLAMASHGVLNGEVSYGPGVVGSAFVFDGQTDAVDVGNPPHLHLQDFTIEAWVQRSSSVVVNASGENAMIFGYGWDGYGFYLSPAGNPVLTKVGVNEVQCPAAITDTEFHHLAVTKSESSVTFYIDGEAYPVAVPYNPGFAFGGSAQIGAWLLNGSFLGKIDEVAVYNRPLTADELASIYNANAAGKCLVPTPAWILYSPAAQRVAAGTNVTLRVSAGGTPPLGYQWLLNDAPVPNATNAELRLNGVTLADAGTYSVIVSNQFGTATSSNGLLTVVVLGPLLVDDFDPALDPLQWSQLSAGWAVTNHAGAASGSNALWIASSGTRAFLTRPINTTNGGTIEFSLRFADGLAYPWEKIDLPQQGIVLEYVTNRFGMSWPMARFDTYEFTNWTRVSLAIPPGAQSPITQFRWRQLATSPWTQNHWALDSVRIDAQPKPPTFLEEPQPLEAVIGQTAQFSAKLAGSTPFTFQWFFNDSAIANATNAVLTLPQVQYAQAGDYSLAVTNIVGYAVSSPARLRVTPPWALFEAGTVTAASAATVTVPIYLTANGNENAFGFSLAYKSSELTLLSVAPAEQVASGFLLLNTNHTVSGTTRSLGVALSLPAGTVLGPGKQEVLLLTFLTGAVTNETSATLEFADFPLPRQLSDRDGVAFSASYSPGTIRIAPAEYEGDLAPRPAGDRALTITDWVLAGRFSALLDVPDSPAEFQRADCAPRSSGGDGHITVTDWVQVGRYAARLDSLNLAGGPLTPAPGKSGGTGIHPAAEDGGRELVLAEAFLAPGAEVEVPVELRAAGDENALGFSVQFDAEAVSYVSATLGKDAVGAIPNINATQAASGRVAFTIALQPGAAFAEGLREVLRIIFRGQRAAAGSYTLSLVNQPVACQLSSAAAEVLESSFTSGKLVITSAPALRISLEQDHVNLLWPSWAEAYMLQESPVLEVPDEAWVDVTTPVATLNNELLVQLPIKDTAAYYRLKAR